MKLRALTRWLARLGLALLALAALLAAAFILAWQSPRWRQEVARQLASLVRSRTGLAVSVGDLSLRPFSGELQLWQLRAGLPQVPPFVTLEHLRARLSWASLWRRPFVVEELEVEGLRFDAQAPIPSGSGQGGSSSPPPVAVNRLRISGSLPPWPMPAPAASWISQLAVPRWRFEGSWRNGLLRGDLQADIQLADHSQCALQMAARGQLDSQGQWQLDFVHLVGPGLRLELVGTGRGLSAMGHAQGRLRLEELLPQLGVAGELELAVRLPQADGDGSFTLAGRDLALSGLSLLKRPSMAPFGLERGRWQLTSHGRFRWQGQVPQVQAEVEVRWQEAEETLLDLALQPSWSGDTLLVPLTGRLLAEQPGERLLAGQLELAPVAQPKAWKLQQLRLEVMSPSLHQSLEALRRHWPQLVPALPPNLPSDGQLELVASASGPLFAPSLRGELTYRVPGAGSITASLAGSLQPLAGYVVANLRQLPLALLSSEASGVVDAQLAVTGNQHRWTAAFAAQGRQLRWQRWQLDRVELQGQTDGRSLQVSSLVAEKGQDQLEAELFWPFADPEKPAEARAVFTLPSLGLEQGVVQGRVRSGALELAAEVEQSPAGPIWARAFLPLASLPPFLQPAVALWPGSNASGPLFLELAAPSLDSCHLASWLPLLDRDVRFQLAASASLQLPWEQPAAAQGELQLAGASVQQGDHLLATLPAARVILGSGRVLLPPTTVHLAGTQLRVEGEARLNPSGIGQTLDPSKLVASFHAQAQGDLPPSLLEPYLSGGQAEGKLQLHLDAEGTPKAWSLWASLNSQESSFFWPSPYPTRLSRVNLSGRLRSQGELTFSGLADLNGGPLSLSGWRSPQGDGEVQLELEGSRFRLDLGLLVHLNADLLLSLPAQGQRAVTGKVFLRRGQLERPLSLEQEVIPFFLAPTATPGSEGGLLDTVALDVALETEEGIRVRNNLADLRLRWDDLWLRGTAWRPHFEGTLRVEPGGLVRAWGQLWRIDRLEASFTGDPLTDPRLEVAVTSSMEDPTIGLPSQGPLRVLAEGSPAAASAQTFSQRFLASAAAAALSQTLGGAAEVSLQPVLVFGETDPTARLTVSRPLSSWASFALSLDLRTAQNQTYLLDLHRIPGLPSLSLQVFTNDAGRPGATLQQGFRWGGGRDVPVQAVPTLRRLRWQAPKSFPVKRVARQLGLRRGHPLPEEKESDLQLELEYLLRQLGYPEAHVKVTRLPLPGKAQRADLLIQLEPGPKVEFLFAGAPPAKGGRPMLRALYRPGLWEKQALQDIRLTTMRLWRAAGYPDPTVEVAVVPETAHQPRRVVVTSRPGERLPRLAQLQVPGLAPEDQAILQAAFSGKVELMELAAGLPAARQYLLATLASLGYLWAKVVGHHVEEDGQRLVVNVELGPRQVLGEVSFAGAEPQDQESLATIAQLAPGQACVRQNLAAAAGRIARWYRNKGFPDARVRFQLEPDGRDATVVHLRFFLQPGRAFRLGEVQLAGSPSLAPSFFRRLVNLTPGQPLNLEQVAEGRRHLWATGRFTRVREEVQRGEDGQATVVYHLQQEPPLSLGYGVRWESSVGAAAVLDLVHRNVAHRLLTLGLRALYEKNQQAGRVYLSVPEILAGGTGADVFVERRRRETPGEAPLPTLVEDSTRLTFQLSRRWKAGWNARLYGRYQRTHLFERSDFFPLDITLTFPYVGLGLARDTRDEPVLARRGWFFNLDLSATGPALGADLSFLRLYGQLASFRQVTLFGRAVTWAQSWRAGLAFTPQDQELIRSERFFAGGEYSVRGYRGDSLGPQEDLGLTRRPAGGKALFVLNQELRFPLPWDLVGVVFVDGGQVWAEPHQPRFSHLSWASGVGVRATTPLGTLRVDLARPWQHQPGQRSFQLYLGFGSVF